MLRYTHIACLTKFSFAINILVCLFPNNGMWRKQRVGGDKDLNLCARCVCADIGLLKK
jgi:hypothetical protein